jgi:hypothetical protein
MEYPLSDLGHDPTLENRINLVSTEAEIGHNPQLTGCRDGVNTSVGKPVCTIRPASRTAT